MWNDEDNNPYGSDFGNPASPKFERPVTPPSGSSSPVNEYPRPETSYPSNVSGRDGSTNVSKKKENYDSRVEQILFEYPDLRINIVHAGKNLEGGGSYIAYTIRTGDFEVRRRYSDFYSLRQTLVDLHPTLVVPPIPEKHSVADYAAKPTKAKEDEAIIDHRKRMLSSFLNRCRRSSEIREDGIFWRFLDPHASWNEVLHSPPISTLPKSNLKVPPLDPTNPSAGHSFLPIPPTSAKLKSGRDPSSSNIISPSSQTSPQQEAADIPAGAHILNKLPASTQHMSESDLDPYFVHFEASSRELEHLLKGNVERVNKRTISHFGAYSEDLAELGARFNGFSLNEQSPTLAAAIEKIGQAVDSTYIATGDLSGSLSAGFSEPMRESAQFASVVRSVLRYRLMKRIQEEMTKDELEKKKSLLGHLERSELEAKRLEQHLEGGGFGGPNQSPSRSFSNASMRSERTRQEDDTASIDSDFPPSQTDSYASPSANQGKSEPTSPATGQKKNGSGNFVTNKLFGRINHAIHGIVDVDPEKTRRDQIGKTKESLMQLEQALEVSEKDVKDASAGVLKSLREFQGEKEEDLRRYMVAYAKSHIAWAKKNLGSWEEARAEVNNIQLQGSGE